MKNFVVVCDYVYVDGGAAKVAIKTAIAMSKYTDFNVYFFGGCGEPCIELVNSKVNIVSLNMPDLVGNPNKLDAFIKGIYNRKAGIELEKLIDMLGKDETVVHIHTWTKVLSSSVFEVCNRKKVETFLTLHDYFMVCPNGGCYNYRKKEICKIKPMSYNCICTDCDSRNYVYKIWRCLRQLKQNDVVKNFKNLNYICISDFQKNKILERGLDISKSVLLKNPIEITKRYKIDCANNENYVFIGRVCKEKGTDLFCEAVRNTGVKGIVVGDGPLMKELKDKYSEIEFTGWLNSKQKEEILKKTRAIVFTSLWYEGSPLTVPEVQAYGIPCIVTDCSAAADDVVDGKNGCLVEPSLHAVSLGIESFKDDNYLKELSRYTYEKFDQLRLSELEYVNNLLLNMGIGDI